MISSVVQAQRASPSGAFQAAKSPPADAQDSRDLGLIPESGRAPGELGNPLQHSRLENAMNRGACGATVHRVAQSWT